MEPFSFHSQRALLEEKEAKHSQAICKMEERNIPSEKFKDHLQQQVNYDGFVKAII